MEQNRAHQCMLNMKPQIIAISKEDKLSKPVILISGFLLSLWTFCIFVVGCFPYGLDSTDSVIVFTGIASHIIISIAVSKGVQHGVKHSDPIYLKPWMYLKVVEGIFLFIGSIFCASSRWGMYVGLTPVGIILLMFGLYISMCVYTTYKQMIPTPAPSINEHVIPEQPPAYDSFTNQKDLA